MADIGFYPQAIQQQYEADPRLAYARALMQQSQQNQQVRAPAQGWANILSSALGKYSQDKVQQDYSGKADQYRAAQQQMTAALLAGKDPKEIAGVMGSNPMLQDRALPFALSTYTAQQSAKLKAHRPMTAAEVAASGLPQGTSAQIDAEGKIDILDKPHDITPYESEMLKNSRNTLAETKRSHQEQLQLERDKLKQQQGPSNLSESEGKAVTYGLRAVDANAKLTQLEKSGYQPANARDRAAAALPGGNAMLRSPSGQSYEQAKQQFIQAVLRRDSGATITPSEFAQTEQTYFPQFGDGPDVQAQKAASRDEAITALRAGSGKGATLIPGAVAGQQVHTPGMPSGHLSNDPLGLFSQ